MGIGAGVDLDLLREAGGFISHALGREFISKGGQALARPMANLSN
jgi:hypothetical protein